DGETDEGFAVGGSCSAGVGECAAAGFLGCSADGSGTVCNADPGDPSAELCDGLDNDCDGQIDNGPDALDSDNDGTPDACDADADGDNVANAEDCAPYTRGVADMPAPIGATLTLTKDVGALLEWTRSDQGHTANVYRGTIVPGQGWAYDESCLLAELPLTQAEDMTIPASGEAFYYLVSARNECGESRIGMDSQQAERYSLEACGSQFVESDGDGVLDVSDNCGMMPNADQSDADYDFVGDVC
ncbi:MAG: hypothetical protein GWM91_19070, partial [Actinobacteria bacterium]|nr:hypothetical protein [Actinomycetota bacterium]NIX52370.1 hypothetical protein [Actinomycetota bacterium]